MFERRDMERVKERKVEREWSREGKRESDKILYYFKCIKKIRPPNGDKLI